MARKAATRDFFISYNKADRAWAEWIAWHLEEAGYTTVLQARDFRPGSNFVLEMDEAAKRAKRTVAVLSADYLDAVFTQPEWAAALAQDPTGEKRTLMPVRVRKCETEGLLAQVVYIDLVNLPEEKAKAVLLDGVRAGRAKPELAPGFPGPAAERSVVQQPSFPGALPPVWNLPHLRNPNLTGRGLSPSGLRESQRPPKAGIHLIELSTAEADRAEKPQEGTYTRGDAKGCLCVGVYDRRMVSVHSMSPARK